MLETEIAHFEKIQNDLIAENPTGGFVVIKDNEVLGVWSDRANALRIGIERFGNVSFLVKDINDDLMHALNFSRKIKFIHAIPNVQI